MTIFRFDAMPGKGRGHARTAIAPFLIALCAAPATAAIDLPVAVPSGQAVVLQDVITNVPGTGLVYRFRFIAPHVARSNEGAVDDMQALCDGYALPRLAELGPQPSRIAISLAERSVEFGEISPDVVQFFEQYSPDESACRWEGF
ncbi:DUF6497 family protein [Oceaniovalibus sp. ACAM 378]|uniref:DUF6497 family protein n=1 Tax=Oceaniovalibus sp. ACAM 378 TaxID=2599923 RepID=UPI0021051373|nr:DUF6497 family protein [Oceaniovalibus sp. ACAM 378]